MRCLTPASSATGHSSLRVSLNAQQFVGNANVLNYAPVILTGAGLGDEAALLSTVGVGVLKTLTTVMAIVQLERMGRRPLLLGGSLVCACAMVMLGVAFSSAPPDSRLAVCGLLLFVTAWSGSFGPLGWLLSAELFPDELRGRAMSIASTVNWTANLTVSLTFLTLSEALGQSTAFFMYAGVAAVALVFVATCVPETMGKSPRTLHRAVRAGCCCGGAGRRKSKGNARADGSSASDEDDEQYDSDHEAAGDSIVVRKSVVVGSIQF